jgi:hypothetical protein
MKLSIQVDADWLKKAQGFSQWPDVVKIRLADALVKSLDDLRVSAQYYMMSNFVNATGALENSLVVNPYASPWEGDLYTMSDYAFRREYGFAGKTDSLGRLYRDDFGIAYMHYALAEEVENIYLNYEDAIMLSFKDLGFY